MTIYLAPFIRQQRRAILVYLLTTYTQYLGLLLEKGKAEPSVHLKMNYILHIQSIKYSHIVGEYFFLKAMGSKKPINGENAIAQLHTLHCLHINIFYLYTL